MASAQKGLSRSEGEYVVVEADYSKENTLAPRHRGNPLIASLPLLGLDTPQIVSLFDRGPQKPDQAVRDMNSLERIGELNSLGDVLYNLTPYQRGTESFISTLRETYVARNALKAEDRRRRLMLHSASSYSDNKLQIPVPKNWRSTAKSLSFIGVTGSGKTTFALTLGMPFGIVIRHKRYAGEPLDVDQLPFIYIQIPHDGTVKSLCLSFFEAIDDAMGYTEYSKVAKRVGGIAEMTILMARVATALSLGVLFVDELQSLKVARGPNIVIVLNLFSRLVERAGISVYTSGTPSIRSILTPGTANTRKISLGGELEFPLMKEGSAELRDFMTKLWDYQYVKNPRELTEPIQKAWFEYGAGNPAFMVLVFALAQRNEIGGKREFVDELSIELAGRRHMATLQPAIRAMRIGTPSAIMALDGMTVGDQLSALRSELGMPTLNAKAYRGNSGDEFEEIDESDSRPTRKSAPKPAEADESELPDAEDPLNMH